MWAVLRDSNSVDNEYNKPFGSLSAVGKLEIKCLGLHRPSLVISFFTIKWDSDIIVFSSDWFQRTECINASESYKSLYCFLIVSYLDHVILRINQ